VALAKAHMGEIRKYIKFGCPKTCQKKLLWTSKLTQDDSCESETWPIFL